MKRVLVFYIFLLLSSETHRVALVDFPGIVLPIRVIHEERKVLVVLLQQDCPHLTRCRVDWMSFLVETIDAQTGEIDYVVKMEKPDYQALLSQSNERLTIKILAPKAKKK